VFFFNKDETDSQLPGSFTSWYYTYIVSHRVALPCYFWKFRTEAEGVDGTLGLDG